MVKTARTNPAVFFATWAPVGSRSAFSAGFTRDLAEVWADKGKAAMLYTAEKQPAVFFATLSNSQNLGDYVLAHGYVREDHVLDNELPLWAPIPALAEMQIALELAVGEVTGLAGFEQKRVMRTGTVASVDNRNWEIGDPAIIRRLSQSRAIALDMESAAIAANGFRFRVPYGTLLCVSDKPLHGEIKLAGMAGEFYRQRVGQHLEIGLRALEKLKAQDWERLHSRKLRSFAEVAFQ
jgi:AMP nucleosidase